MPDRFWICENCDENNPPYTEACRNCYKFAPVVPCPATFRSETTQPEVVSGNETFVDAIRPGKPLYLILLGLLIAGWFFVLFKGLFFQGIWSRDTYLASILMGLCIWQIRAYFRNDTVWLKSLPLPSARIDNSKENREWRGVAACLSATTYVLVMWASW